jgi:hypothetical protein
VAITHAGKRCSGGWASALHPLFAWDPIAGIGRDGPSIVLCHRHRHYAYRSKPDARHRIVGGWIGPANRHGYGYAVWSTRTGWKHAAAWLRLSRPCKAGDRTRTDAIR